MNRLMVVLAVVTLAVPAGAAGQDAGVRDGMLMRALAGRDKAAIAPLLDPEVIWTDAEGRTVGKDTLLANLPAPSVAVAATKSYDYGTVVTIRSDEGKMHVLRVWAKRPSEWRLLVYHEVKQAEQAASGPPAAPVKDCVNPCRRVPYQPRDEAESGVIQSWQALETAVTAGDSKAWATHFADEFVVISSAATDPVTKAGRMAALDKQKAAGTNGAPAGLAPDHTRMFTIGDTVVMNCQTLPHRGKPAHITRVWIKRNGAWLMTASFQTTIQSAAPVTSDEEN